MWLSVYNNILDGGLDIWSLMWFLVLDFRPDSPTKLGFAGLYSVLGRGDSSMTESIDAHLDGH